MTGSNIAILALLVLCCIPAACWTQAADKDRVSELEGYMNFTGQFELFSGYLDISQSPLIRTHYVFATSTRDPDNDDVVLWLNGGPGCSGLIGFSQ